MSILAVVIVKFNRPLYYDKLHFILLNFYIILVLGLKNVNFTNLLKEYLISYIPFYACLSTVKEKMIFNYVIGINFIKKSINCPLNFLQLRNIYRASLRIAKKNTKCLCVFRKSE